MVKGYVKMDEPLKKYHIKTKSIYIKYEGKTSFDTDVLLMQETDNAILVRVRILSDDHNIHETCSKKFMNCFSTNSMWIAKSKLIEFEELIK